MKPAPLVLAAMVALRVDNMGDTCPAWMDTAERRCGKPVTDGHLCARHHQVAVRRWDVTDTNVTRMAALHREADQLRAWLKEDS